MLWELYPSFLDTGYSPLLFWDLSFAEIIDVIESYRKKEEQKASDYKEQIKMQAVMNNILAKQIIELLAANLTGKNEVTKLSEYFPTLFNQENAETDNLLELNKARFEEFAYWHNLKIKGGGKG